MPDAPVMVRHTHLETFIVATLVAMKMPRPPVEITAGLMVRTDLRGVDSHGIGMLPRYVEWWREGYLVLDAEPRVDRDDGAMALLDASKCLGHYPATLAMEKAIEKAKAWRYRNLAERTGMTQRKIHNAGHCLAAIDPSRFRPLDEFKRDMDDMFEALKSAPRAEGQERIYVAGEPEAESEHRRRKDGILLAPVLVAQCDEFARELGVAPLVR